MSGTQEKKTSAGAQDVKAFIGTERKSVINKEGFLMECIGEYTQDVSMAADISIQMDRVIPGFAHAFPMLWCMHGIKEETSNTGHCYVMKVTGKDIFKIGFSSSVKKRLSQNERIAANEMIPLISVPGDFRAENELHNLFALYRIDGEWYGGETMSEYVDILCGIVVDRPGITAKALAMLMKWRMWFSIEEEREYKSIVTFADGLLIGRNTTKLKKQEA